MLLLYSLEGCDETGASMEAKKAGAAGAGTGLERWQKQVLAAEAGGSLIDPFQPYLMCAPPLRVVCKLRPLGSVLLPGDFWSRC